VPRRSGTPGTRRRPARATPALPDTAASESTGRDCVLPSQLTAGSCRGRASPE
jgi:hypothetical protein